MSESAEDALCPVCRVPAAEFATGTVLGRHTAEYFRCPRCGMVFVPDPHWLGEAYQLPIASTDVGIVSRTFETGLAVRLLLRSTRRRSTGRLLDFAGGTGMFVRFLRDSGYPFEYYDEFPANRFAVGHEARDLGSHEVVTAFEVLEHLTDPVGVCEQLLPVCKLFICTTELVPEPTPLPGEWWYYSPSTGQHVTFWTKRALGVLADRFDMHLASDGNLHVFSRRRLPPGLVQLAARPKVAALLSPWTARPTLRDEDYERALQEGCQSGQS